MRRRRTEPTAQLPRQPILSVTLKDCDVETFRGSGPGGQHRNKRDTGVRVRHRESGAVGQATDSRSQHDNKRAAFKRMVATDTFQAWLRIKLGRGEHVKAEVERSMWPHNIKTEVFVDGEWRDG